MHVTHFIHKRRGFHFSFRDFVESGGDDSASPFLKSNARKFAARLQLPLAITSGFLLALGALFTWLGYPAIYLYPLIAGVYFLSGTRAMIDAVTDLLEMKINIDVLMTLAAYLCLITDSALEGALLLVLFDISRNMERLVTFQARSSLMSLRSLAPEKAWFLNSSKGLSPSLKDQAQLRHIQDIPPGSFIVVKAGEIVPLDGVIVEGSSSFSLAHLTGEPMPITLGTGQEISSGSRAIDSPVLLKVIKPAQEATLTRIIRMVHEAQEAKPKLQLFFDRVSDLYAKAIILTSFLLAVGLPLFTSLPFLGLEGSLYRSLAFMIAASPCALILAVPIAYLSAISACARAGIVLKAGTVLDQLASCKQLAFDKTGTLTQGQAQVTSTLSFGLEIDSLKQSVLSLEKHTKHPLAEALIRHLPIDHKQASNLEAIQLHTGLGMSAKTKIKGQIEEIRIGKSAWALEIVDDSLKPSLQQALADFHKRHQTHSLATWNRGACIFTFQDLVRENLQSAIEELQLKQGLELFMLTGDHEASARAIAKEVGIEKVYFSLKPQDKLAIIHQLREKAPLAMVGDGINDAPALAGSTVGIAMASIGSLAATSVADILLLKDELELLPWLFQKAKSTRRIVWQNLSLAASVILIASSSSLLGWLPLWAAVIAHEGGTVLVGLNGLRLIRSLKK